MHQAPQQLALKRRLSRITQVSLALPPRGGAGRQDCVKRTHCDRRRMLPYCGGGAWRSRVAPTNSTKKP